MSFNFVDRNDPCPCGTGKKFKKCAANATRKKCNFTAKVLSTSHLTSAIASSIGSSLAKGKPAASLANRVNQ